MNLMLKCKLSALVNAEKEEQRACTAAARRLLFAPRSLRSPQHPLHIPASNSSVEYSPKFFYDKQRIPK
jgi:hypothetical protein